MATKSLAQNGPKRLRRRTEAEAARARKAAGPAGRAEGFEAHAADALAQMLQGQAQGPGSGADVVVVDLAAYRRGHTHPGERGHIVEGR